MKQQSAIRWLEFAPSTGGILLLSLALASCGGGGPTPPPPAQPNPVPSITSLDRSSATAGSQAFTLTVNGSNFVSSSVVRWGGSSRTTTYQSSTRLTASILAADIASAGSVEVTVFNPAPGGGTSNSLTFTISATPPLTLTTARLPDTTSGKAYYFTLSAAGGVPTLVDGAPTYQWSVDAGNLPADLTLDSTTGRISGEVTGSTSSFTVRVTDFAATPNSATRNFTLQVLPPPLGRNDACTPGSTAGTTQISNGRIRASFSPYGDVDVYSFNGTAGRQVSIEIFAQRLELDGDPLTRDSWGDTLLELLDDTCPPPALNGTNALAFNDDLSDPPNHVQDSRVVLTLDYTGFYFIRVRDFRGDGRPDLIYELFLSGAD